MRDRVLVKLLAYDGKHKFANRFGEDIYIVIKRSNQNIPVSVVRAPNGRERTLYRSHLMPVSMKFEVGVESR